MAQAELDILLKAQLDVASLNRQIEIVKTSLGPLGKTIKPIDEQAWAKAFGRVDDEAGKAGDALDEVGDKVEKTDSIWSKAFKFAAVQQGTQALLGSVGSLSQSYRDLDAATANLKTLGDEAAAMAPNLRAAAIEMSKDLPFAAAEIQTTMFDALASGVKGGEEGLKSFADTAAKLATGGGAGIGDATKLLAGQLNAYGKSAEDAAKFSDIFFNTVNFGVTSVPELANTLSNVVPTAASLGVEIENVGAALATMTSKGVPTAQSTTKLNQLLLELAKPGAALKPILDAAGVSLESLKQEDLPVTLGKVKKALEETGATAISAFSSSEASAAFNVLAGDIEGFSQTFLDVRDTAGSAQFAYEQMGDSIDVKTKQMMAAVNAFIIQGLDVMGDGFVGLVAAGQQLAPVVSTVAGLGTIIPDGTGAKIKDAATSIISRMIPGLIGQTAATQGATVAQFSLNKAVAANPLGAAIVLITAAVAATKLLSDALHETAAEKLEDHKAEVENIQSTREGVQARYDALKSQVALGQSYQVQVESVQKLKAAANDEKLSLDERAAKQREATAATAALSSRTADLTAQFPKSADAGKSFEENLKAIQGESLKATDELIKVGGQLSKLDAQMAQATKITLQLETTVATEELEDALTDALDISFSDQIDMVRQGDFTGALTSVFTEGLGGFGTEISEFLFGTSVARKTGEDFAQKFKTDVFNAKTADEINAAQSKMIAEVRLKGASMNMSAKDQNDLIKSIQNVAAKRKAELDGIAKADAQLSAANAKNIQGTFQATVAAGGDVSATIQQMSKDFGLSAEKISRVALDGELRKASDAGELTDKKIQELARTFGKTGQEIKDAAFESEIRKAAEAGTITTKQIDELAKKWGKTPEEARKVVAEQEKMVQKAKEAQGEVKRIGDAFNEAKKAAGEAVAGFTADLAELNKRMREAKTKEERAEIERQRKATIDRGKVAVDDLKQLEKDDANAKKALGLGGASKVKTLRDIEDQLTKIRRESASIRADIELKAIEDESIVQRRTMAERQAAELDAANDEIAAARKATDLTADAKAALEKTLSDKLRAITERQYKERTDLESKIAATSAKKVVDERLALEKRALDDSTTLNELRLQIATDQDVKAGESGILRAQEIAAIRLDALKASTAAEISSLVERNEAVIKAQVDFDKAIAQGDAGAAIEAQSRLALARAAAIINDPIVIAAQRKAEQQRAALTDETNRDIRRAEIDSVTDLAERKRQLTIFDAEKTYQEQLALAKGNAALELQAHEALQKAKFDATIAYLRESNPVFDSAMDATQRLTQTFAEVYGAQASEQRAKEEEDHQKRMEEIRQEQKALQERFDAGVISWEEYQDSLSAIDQAREDEQKARDEKAEERAKQARERISGAFQASADQQMSLAQAAAKGSDEMFGRMAASAALTFGAMTAAGASFGTATLGMLLDLVTKSINLYIPQIIAASISLLGPIAGPIAAGTAIVLVQAGLASARGQIGAEGGVHLIDKSYSKAPGPTDTIPIWIAEGETIFSKPMAQKHDALFRHLFAGRDEREYFNERYRGRDDDNARKLDRVIDELREVKAATRSSRQNVAIQHRFAPTRVRGTDIEIVIENSRRQARGLR